MDIHVLQRVDTPCRLLDLPSNCLWYKLLHQLLQVTARCLPCHNLEHFLPDLSNLTRLRIRRLAHLGLAAFGESDGEEAEEVTISRLDIDMSLNEGLPFAHERPELIRGEGHAMEVSEAVLILNFVDAKLNLAERLLLVLVKVAERDLNDAALERVICIFCALMSVRV